MDEISEQTLGTLSKSKGVDTVSNQLDDLDLEIANQTEMNLRGISEEIPEIKNLRTMENFSTKEDLSNH